MKQILIILLFSISICKAQTDVQIRSALKVDSVIKANLIIPNKNIAAATIRLDSFKIIFSGYDVLQKRVAQLDSLQNNLKTKLAGDSVKFIALNVSIKSLTDSIKKIRSDIRNDTMKVRFWYPLKSQLDSSKILNIYYKP